MTHPVPSDLRQVVAAALREDVGTGADDVRVQERPGVMQGVVVVRLGSVVDHHIGVSHQAVHQGGVGDVSLDEPEPVLRQVPKRGQVARVGQLVQHRDVVVRVFQNVVDKI